MDVYDNVERTDKYGVNSPSIVRRSQRVMMKLRFQLTAQERHYPKSDDEWLDDEVFDTNPSSCSSTPRVRRKSVRRIFERMSISGTNGQSSEKTATNKSKTVGSHCLPFSLYLEAIDQSLFSEEELQIWKIQEKFPNDDLRLYEGIFCREPSNPTSFQVGDDTNFPSQLSSPDLDINSPFARLNPGYFDFNVDKDAQHGHSEFDSVARHKSKSQRGRVSSAPEGYGSPKTNLRFPHGTLGSLEQYAVFSGLSSTLQAKFRKMAQRRQSAPSIVIRGVLGKSSKLPASLYNKDDTCVPLSPISNSQRLSLKFGSHGAMLNLSKRQYVMEGKVQLTTGMQTQDRYMFLFTDLLLIAKAKSGSNYKLKYRIRVCELWIATCLDEVCELTKSHDKSFVLGWPTTNCVATFSSPESKELWLSALIKKINDEKEKESPKTTTLRIISRDLNNSSHVKLVTVSHKHTAKDVVRLAVKEFDLEENEDDYQLWVMSRKEGTAYPLIGHENPHAIQISHVRDAISANGIVPEMNVTSVSEHEILNQPDVRNRCQFILRSSRQSPAKFQLDQTQRRLARIKNKTPAAFFNWARKRHATGSTNAQRQDSSDSGLASMSGNSGTDGSSFSSPSPPSTSSPVSPKLFSRPLNEICENGEIPAPITSILNVLYRKAPYTTGIFRKSANARTTRLLKEKLNDEVEVAMSDVPIHVIAALFKDFLRNIPNSILDSALYQQWTEAIDQPDDEGKMTSLRKLLRDIDDVNRMLVRRLAIVLNRIASHSKRNNMTSFNLSVCIAPSLLWPPSSAGPFTQADSTRKVTEILQYMVDRCSEIFDGIVLNDTDWPPEVDQKSEGEENDEYEVEVEKPTTPHGETEVPEISVTEDGEEKENVVIDDEIEGDSDVSHFSRSRMTRRQLQRRKPQSRCERMARLSQDSLDQDLNDEVMESDQNQIQVTIHTRGTGTDACSMSNDSGFTTLSGEDEDISLSISNKRRLESLSSKQNPDLLLSTSAGSDLYKMMSERLDAAMRTATEELKGMWDPSALTIRNGEILDEPGLQMCVDEEHTNETRLDRTNDHTTDEREIGEFRRRRSQPEVSSRSLTKASSVGESIDQQKEFVADRSSRFVAGITTPSVEYAGSSDNEGAGEMNELTFSTSHQRQRPTYMRLNDTGDDTASKSKASNLVSDENHVLATEYLRKLRSRSAGEILHGISEPRRTLLSDIHIRVGESGAESVHSTNIRPCTLPLRQNDPGTGDHANTCDGGAVTPENESTERLVKIKIGPISSSLKSSSDVSFVIESTYSRGSISSQETPLSRKFNSLRTNRERKREIRKAQSHGAGDNELRRDGVGQSEMPLSPIQKLTENLNSLPDFRQQSRIQFSADRYNPEVTRDEFSDRKKSSSVRLSRSNNHRPSRGLQSHFIKTKTPLKLNQSNHVTGTSFKAEHRASSQSPVRSAEGSSKQLSSEIHVVRRRRNRLHATGSTQTCTTDGESMFSKSLPSGTWRQKIIAPVHDPNNNKSMPKVALTEVQKNDVFRENKQPILHNCRNVGSTRSRNVTNDKATVHKNVVNIERKKVQEISKSFTSSSEPQAEETDRKSPLLEPGTVSVKSKINAFNHLIHNHASRSNSSTSTPSPIPSDRLFERSPGDVKTTPETVSSPSAARATFVQLESMLSDFHPENYTSRSRDSSRTRLVRNEFDSGCKSKDSDSRNGLIVRCGTPDITVAKSSPKVNRTSSEKPHINVMFSDVSSPTNKQGSHSQRPSPQPLTDNVLFSLSESFAFGNRKSPRCLTPNGTPNMGNTPQDSPVALRRRGTSPAATKHSRTPPNSERKCGRWNEIGHSQTKSITNNSASGQLEGRNRRSASAHRRRDPHPSISTHSDNNNFEKNSFSDSVSFMGFEQVLHSEESYV